MGNTKTSLLKQQDQQFIQTLLNRPHGIEVCNFDIQQIGHHGLPENTKFVTFCPKYKLLAIGTTSNCIKIYGQPLIEQVIQDKRFGTSISYLQFTNFGHLVAVSSDGNLRIWKFTSADSDVLVGELPSRWTQFDVTAVEMPPFSVFPFFYVATADGEIHVVNEDEALLCQYSITSSDTSMTIPEEEDEALRITCLASNPQDSNHLLIAYENGDLLLWDFTKRKLIRKYTYPEGQQREECVIECVSWHTSGKKFVVGYRSGSIGFYRIEKSYGVVYNAGDTPPGFVNGVPTHRPVRKIVWSSQGPISKVIDAGSIILIGGTKRDEQDKITVIQPPDLTVSGDDSLQLLGKPGDLPWVVISYATSNEAECIDFALCDILQSSRKEEDPEVQIPKGIIVLSGNPMGGCVPVASVHPFVVADPASWSFKLSDPIPVSGYLQSSRITATKVISITGIDESLRSGLLSTSQVGIEFLTRYPSGWEWPISGGFVEVPEVALFQSGIDQSKKKSTMIITAHEDRSIGIWETRLPIDSTSKGTLQCLHRFSIANCFLVPAEEIEVCQIEFCHHSRTLAVGMKSGRIAVFKFGYWRKRSVSGFNEDHFAADSKGTAQPASTNHRTEEPTPEEGEGFRLSFSIHVHGSDITRMCMSTAYGHLAVADSYGAVSLISLSTAAHNLIVFDLVADDVKPITALCINEINIKNAMGGGGGTLAVLFVSRGADCVEVYELSSGNKISEMSISSKYLSSPSQLIVINSDRSELQIPGHKWTEEADTLTPEKIGGREEESDQPKLVRSLSEEKEITRKIAMESIAEVASLSPKVEVDEVMLVENENAKSEPVAIADDTTQQDRSIPWSELRSTAVEIGPGPAGLLLHRGVKNYALVMGFANDSKLPSKGVRIGALITSINGLDVSGLGLDEISSMMYKMKEQYRLITFVDAKACFPDVFEEEVDEPAEMGFNDIAADKECDKRPRFLISCCERSVSLSLLQMPSASSMAAGEFQITLPLIAQVDLPAALLNITVLDIPIDDRIEKCLVCADQSGSITVLSLLALEFIWRTQFQVLGCALDLTKLTISSSGELIFLTEADTIVRYSIFSAPVAAEAAMFQDACVKPRLVTTEYIPGGRRTSHAGREMRKNSTQAFLKKLVGQKQVDLNQTFAATREAIERTQLLGDRQAASLEEETSKSDNIKRQTASTKSTLQQAAQNLQKRGEKLQDLADKTEEMVQTSEDFYQTMKKFNEREANKKWWQI